MRSSSSISSSSSKSNYRLLCSVVVRDQSKYLKKSNRSVLCLDRGSPPTPARLDKIARGKYSFVLTTIEQLCKTNVIEALRAGLVACLIIDEAHCVVKWKDIKQVYNKIAFIRACLGGVALLMLTATANSATVQEVNGILKTKHLVDEHSSIIIRGDPIRKAIYYISRQFPTGKRQFEAVELGTAAAPVQYASESDLVVSAGYNNSQWTVSRSPKTPAEEIKRLGTVPK